MGFCIMYTKHKNQNGYFKLSEYCEQYEGLENFELYTLLKNSDKGDAGLSDYSDNSANGIGALYTVHCIQMEYCEPYEFSDNSDNAALKIIYKALNILIMHAHENGYGLCIVYKGNKKKKGLKPFRSPKGNA